MVTSIEKRLLKAEKLCEISGARFTSVRKDLLQLIYSQNEPMSAYDLLRLLRDQHPKAEAITVYRALDFLQKHHLIHRIATQNAYTACDAPQHDHHTQLLVCESCGNVQEIEAEILESALQETAKRFHFVLSASPTEIGGSCQMCVDR